MASRTAVHPSVLAAFAQDITPTREGIRPGQNMLHFMPVVDLTTSPDPTLGQRPGMRPRNLPSFHHH